MDIRMDIYRIQDKGPSDAQYSRRYGKTEAKTGDIAETFGLNIMEFYGDTVTQSRKLKTEYVPNSTPSIDIN